MTAGMNSIDTASIMPVLAVTEPIALPVAISTEPEAAAITETSISGRVVARETIVAPMMNWGMPDTDAIHEAASTNQSPPFIMHMSPAANRTNTIILLNTFSFFP